MGWWQVGCIRQALARRGIRGVAVSTVDGSQGAEADVILLSLVRANSRGSIGFVREFRRLNVAITRAKQALVMFGHASTLSTGAHGDSVADLVRARLLSRVKGVRDSQSCERWKCWR